MASSTASETENSSSDSGSTMDSDVPDLRFGDTINIFVGPERTKFVAHTAILRERSAYFRAMLNPNSNWIERRLGQVKLDDIDATVFKDFITLLYNPHDINLQSHAVKVTDNGVFIKLRHFHDLYHLAERMLCEVVQNKTIDLFLEAAALMHEGRNLLISAADVRQMEEVVALRCKFSKAWDDVWLSQSKDHLQDAVKDMEKIPRLFLRDWTNANLRNYRESIQSMSRSNMTNRCKQYHSHVDSITCATLEGRVKMHSQRTPRERRRRPTTSYDRLARYEAAKAFADMIVRWTVILVFNIGFRYAWSRLALNWAYVIWYLPPNLVGM